MVSILCLLQMIDVDVPQTIFTEQGRELYGAQLLQIQVRTCNHISCVSFCGSLVL